MSKTVSILGCGWLGLPLSTFLTECGMKVNGSTAHREKLSLIRAAGAHPYFVDMSHFSFQNNDFFKADVLIITVPPSAKQYPTLIRNIIDTLKISSIRHVIFISSTAVYPNLNRIVYEADAQSIPSPRSGIQLLDVENAFKDDDNFQTTVIRFAGLYGPGREPGKFMPRGTQIKGPTSPVNLVHLEDCLEVIKTIVIKNVWGETFNVCAPEHPQKKAFYTKACQALNRPIPEFSNEDASFKIISAAKLMTSLNYKFIHADPMQDV